MNNKKYEKEKPRSHLDDNTNYSYGNYDFAYEICI